MAPADRCPRHPYDRKPFRADPGIHRGLLAVLARGELPFVRDGRHGTRPAPAEFLDQLCAQAEALGHAAGVPVTIEMAGGTYYFLPGV